MKKNAMLKVAAGLMVAVLLTTCAISSTFAKYVNAAEAGNEQKATAAKWDLTVAPAITGTLFATEYKTTGDKILAESIVTPANNIVAPGTTKSAKINYSVTGTSEVAFVVKAVADVEIVGFEIEGDDYCPLVFTIGGTNYTIGSDDIDTFEGKLEAAIAKVAATTVNAPGKYGEGQPNPAITGTDLDISWSWPFVDTDANVQDDDSDTTLGKAGTATVSVKVGFGVEQSDVGA